MRQFKLILSLCLGSFGAFAQISLQECINLGEKHNPQYQQLGLIKEAEELQIKELKKNSMPQASLSGQATWQSQVTSVSIPLPNFSISPPPKDQYRATLDVTQSLWDGGMTKNQSKIASASARSDEKNVQSNLYQIHEQLSNLYYGVLLADKQLANFQISRNDVENQIKKLSASVENGTAVKANLMVLEARLIELNQQVQEIQSRKNSALKGLSILTGTSINQVGVAKTDVLSDENLNRPELAYFEAQQSLLDANKGLIKAKNAPKINLFATGGYGRPGLNMLSADFNTYFIGGVSIKVPLSYLYLKTQQADIQQIRINQDRVNVQKEAFLQGIELKVASQKEDILKLQQQIKEDAKLIEIRNYVKKISENRLENGIITASDYLIDANAEATARESQSLHEVQLMQNLTNLKITLGK